MNIENLSSYHRVLQRIRESWNAFSLTRADRLKQQDRHGIAAEKVTENILEDLFTTVLDWPLSDLNNQVQHSDLLLTSLGIKYLIIEAKRPGALAWDRRAVEAALNQAVRYASEQKVKCLGISDGVMLYAADLQCGGLQDRCTQKAARKNIGKDGRYVIGYLPFRILRISYCRDPFKGFVALEA
ncbi:MAG: hypothetical protein ACLPX5_13055 [Dissulfurispiraceae bacterium]